MKKKKTCNTKVSPGWKAGFNWERVFEEDGGVMGIQILLAMEAFAMHETSRQVVLYTALHNPTLSVGGMDWQGDPPENPAWEGAALSLVDSLSLETVATILTVRVMEKVGLRNDRGQVSVEDYPRMAFILAQYFVEHTRLEGDKVVMSTKDYSVKVAKVA